MGYLYAFRQPGSENVKIGRTTRDPRTRLAEINNTSVVQDFVLEYSAKVDDDKEAEKLAHRMLERARVRNDREFFKCSKGKAKKAIDRAATRVNGTLFQVREPSKPLNRRQQTKQGSLIIRSIRRLFAFLFGVSISSLGLLILILTIGVILEDLPRDLITLGFMLGLVAISLDVLRIGIRLVRGRPALSRS